MENCIVGFSHKTVVLCHLQDHGFGSPREPRHLPGWLRSVCSQLLLQEQLQIFFTVARTVFIFLRYHPSSRAPLALIGASAFAFNKYPRKPYIFSKLLYFQIIVYFFLKIKILTRFRNEKLFVKVGATVNLSPGQPKINGRSQLK